MAASGVPISDMEDDKFYFIYESIKTFNPDKNSKYSTWLANWTKYKCLSKITASNKEFTGGESFLDYCVNKDTEADAESEEAKLDIFEHVNEILESESEETQKIFKLRYFSNDKKNKKWSDIGDKLGISTQTAINKHNRAIEKIKMKVKKKNVDFSTK